MLSVSKANRPDPFAAHFRCSRACSLAASALAKEIDMKLVSSEF